MRGRVWAMLSVCVLCLRVSAGAQEPRPPTERGSDQEEERLWMPEGYRFLSNEERQTLSAEEVKTITARNTEILIDAARKMTAEERSAVLASHQRVAESRQLSQAERQYASRVSMLLLSEAAEEHSQKERRAQEAAFARMLKEQEDSSKGFPTDQESVENEAMAVRALLRQGEDLQKLYLRILRPLRSRPWNDSARVTLRQILRSDPVSTLPEVRKRSKSLIEAALVFIEARRAESTGQGAWDSLEAFLRLSFLHELAPAKKLFASAVAKNAQDVESHSYPLLIAEIEEDADAIRTYLPRAQKAWPRKEDLDRALYEDIGLLPADLQAKARGNVAARYKEAYPADWESRQRTLAQKLWDRRSRQADPQLWDRQFQEVENETEMLLALPHTILPEPHRVHFRSMNLRAKAGLGYCGPAHREVADFEAEAGRVYPARQDPSSPPRPRTAAQVRALRVESAAHGKESEAFRRSLEDGSFQEDPEWRNLTPAERATLLEALSKQLERSRPETEALKIADDAAASAEWSRRELAQWETTQPMTRNATYDLAGQAERLGIGVREAVGKCYLEKKGALEAARVLKPCVGGGRNIHTACVDPLVEAGLQLVSSGNIPAAVEIYRSVEATYGRADRLFEALEQAAPGRVQRHERPPLGRTTPSSAN